ncbi:MAG: hypothetical protein EA396_00425 [Anaerolineaceae bacterium]|nr:MAG: hypothetical protein EA396_00425 [Anaerolineaceae bacterium]
MGDQLTLVGIMRAAWAHRHRYRRGALVVLALRWPEQALKFLQQTPPALRNFIQNTRLLRGRHNHSALKRYARKKSPLNSLPLRGFVVVWT